MGRRNAHIEQASEASDGCVGGGCCGAVPPGNDRPSRQVRPRAPPRPGRPWLGRPMGWARHPRVAARGAVRRCCTHGGRCPTGRTVGAPKNRRGVPSRDGPRKGKCFSRHVSYQKKADVSSGGMAPLPACHRARPFFFFFPLKLGVLVRPALLRGHLVLQIAVCKQRHRPRWGALAQPVPNSCGLGTIARPGARGAYRSAAKRVFSKQLR